MKTKEITKIVKEDGTVYLEQCFVANTALSRMVGLLAHKSLGPSEGLWIEPCTSIHTLFMKFAIDAVFLDRKGKVIGIYHSLRPWRLSWFHPFAIGVIEAPAGHSKRNDLKVGEVLKICRFS